MASDDDPAPQDARPRDAEPADLAAPDATLLDAQLSDGSVPDLGAESDAQIVYDSGSDMNPAADAAHDDGIYVAGRPSAGSFQLVCEWRVVPLGATQPVMTCRTQFRDRYEGRIAAGTPVFFLAEGAARPVRALVDDSGDATVDLILSGESLGETQPWPYELEGLSAERDWGTHNPRDGLGTVVAYVRGEEHYTDVQGDGAYGPGDRLEPHHDLSEPFVDANDDGTWSDGEVFVDTNGDGVWTDANGRWDHDTDIWAVTHIVHSGPFSADASWVKGECLDCGAVHPGCGDDTLNLSDGATAQVQFAFVDENGNCLPENRQVVLELRENMAQTGAFLALHCFHEFVPREPIGVLPARSFQFINRSASPADAAPERGTLTLDFTYQTVGAAGVPVQAQGEMLLPYCR